MSVIGINFCNVCNLKCSGCINIGKISQNTPKFVSYETAINQINYAKDNGYKTILSSGAEILLWPYLDRIVKYCNNIGINISIVTNGTLLSSDKIKALNGIKTIILSIDRIHEASIRIERKKGEKLFNYNEVLSNLNSYFTNNVIVNTTISVYDIKEFYNSDDSYIENLGKFLGSYDLSKWNIFPLCDSSKSPKEKNFNGFFNELTKKFPGIKIINKFPQDFESWEFINTDNSLWKHIIQSTTCSSRWEVIGKIL